VEAAHDHLDAGLEKGPANIDGAGELVRLHADETDHSAVGGLQPADQPVKADDRIGFVDESISISTSSPTTFRRRLSAIRL
jgi:hypothetical protein